MADDIYVYAVDLPEGIDEMITPCDGGYTLYVDKRLSKRKAVKAVTHAIGHVIQNDWEKAGVQTIERDAHEQQKDQNRVSVPQIQFRIPD